MPKSPFDEEFTPEEEAALQDTTLPPAEEEGEGSVEEAVAAAAQPAPEPEAAAPAAAEPKPGEPPAAEPAPAAAQPTPEEVEEQDLAAFLEKHKGKSPDEVLKLAFQQSKRASREAATNRQVRNQVSAIAERARAASERRAKLEGMAPDVKAAFREKLAADPDAATAELFDQLIDQRVQEADTEAQTARIEEAIHFADAHIPEFGKNWAGMKDLATEVGYTDDELNAIDDGRPLIVLYLASLTGRLMKSGIMDRFGNIVNVPQMETQPLDPRLSGPDPQKTLGGAGARGARGAQSVEQQLQEISQMSDEEFAKLDDATLNALLKAA
jgi:hypothetical protein